MGRFLTFFPLAFSLRFLGIVMILDADFPIKTAINKEEFTSILTENSVVAI